MRKMLAAAVIGLPILLGGCAVPIVGGLTLNEFSSATSIFSSTLTGKGLGEHALDLVTGMDCRVVESVLRSDREFCEVRGSVATQSDFNGVIGIAVAAMKPEPAETGRSAHEAQTAPQVAEAPGAGISLQ